ncbi:hypothetical protein [Actinophytocola sp.]|uniref:hypothetical protein n=1 Tax=Actinophytocola sp. TaxID=1872138 RepID=UPI0038998C1C
MAISILALGVSIFTLRERRVLDRRDLFLKMHERLLDQDVMRGRRILTREVHSLFDVRQLYIERHNDYEIVSRALSMLDFAALYVKQGYIEKNLFIDEWGVVYVELRKHFLLLVEEKAKDDPSYMWSWRHFKTLADEASLRLATP